MNKNKINKIVIFPIVLFGFLFFAKSSLAATYYVDVTGGADGNAGTSEGAAWQTINKVNISSFSPGDSILFKKGETWQEQLTVPSSGSSGNPITFGAYGTGSEPIIDGGATRTRTILIDGKNYVTVQNIKCINSAPSDQGSIYVNNSGYIILDGLVLDNNAGFAGIYAEGSGAGKQIINSTISNTSHASEDRGNGIILDSATGHTVSGNTIHHNDAAGIKLRMWDAPSNSVISSNTIYQNGASGITINTDSAGIIVENNTVYENGQIVADTYGIDLFKVGSNNVVRYNKVHGHNYVGTDAGGIRFDAEPGGIFGTGNKIYYNVIYNERNGIQLLGPDGAVVYNNSIYNSGVTGIWLHGADSDSSVVKNNIVHTAGTNLIYNQDATNSVVNYNLYYPSTGTKFNWNDIAYNFADWKTNSSQDANSPTPADPLFVSASDFHLQASSPAINTGVDVGLTTDYEDNPVPYGLTPDIGAYEYQSGIDSTPDAFVFTDITGATRSTQYTSNAITVAGVDADADITITGGTYSKNGGAYTSDAGTVSSSDDISVRVTSSGSYSTAVDAVLTIGGVSDTYTVTTSAYSDSTPPVLSAGAPSGTLAAGTTSANLTLTTDENATCKFGIIPDTAYDSLPLTFTTTGGISHAHSLTGLANGTDYNYYVRCSDGSNNLNPSDYIVTFGVANSPPEDDDDDDSSSKKKATSKRGISQSKKSIAQGQVLIQRGKKFSKSSRVALYFSRPNGSYYPPMIITTTKNGSFSVTYRVTKPKGTYKWYAVNLKTGWKSKTASYQVK